MLCSLLLKNIAHILRILLVKQDKNTDYETFFALCDFKRFFAIEW